jgi:hypothetical protein
MKWAAILRKVLLFASSRSELQKHQVPRSPGVPCRPAEQPAALRHLRPAVQGGRQSSWGHEHDHRGRWAGRAHLRH